MKNQIRVWLCAALFFVPSAAKAHPSYGLVIDSKGNIYFSDEGASAIWQVDARGHARIVVRDVHCHSLAIDSRDNVYGEDVQYESSNNTYISKVWMRAPSGAVTIVMPPLADKVDVMRYPFADSRGQVYALELGRQETALQMWSTRGGFRTIFGGQKMVRDGPAAVARFAWPRAFAFTGPGSAYFVDGSMIRQLAPNGAVRTIATIGSRNSTVQASLMGVAVAANGDVLTADVASRSVWRIAHGSPADTAGSPSWFRSSVRPTSVVAKSEYGWLPTAVLERAGAIFILEHGEYNTPTSGFLRVRRLGANGRAQTIATVGSRPR